MTADIIDAAFRFVCKMEDDLEEARVLGDGIGVLATTASCGDEKIAAVISRLGWLIADHCKNVEETRGELFKLLHPRRAEFEEKGWPGDDDPAAQLEEEQP